MSGRRLTWRHNDMRKMNWMKFLKTADQAIEIIFPPLHQPNPLHHTTLDNTQRWLTRRKWQQSSHVPTPKTSNKCERQDEEDNHPPSQWKTLRVAIIHPLRQAPRILTLYSNDIPHTDPSRCTTHLSAQVCQCDKLLLFQRFIPLGLILS